MISLRGVEGIKNLCMPERCDICGKKRKHIVLCGSICVRCTVWTEGHWCYIIAKYIRLIFIKMGNSNSYLAARIKFIYWIEMGTMLSDIPLNYVHLQLPA